MHLDVQVCVPCMLTGVGGVLGAFQYSVSHCLETRSLAESEASLSLGRAARALKASLHSYPLMLGLLICRDMCDFLHGFKGFKFRFSYLPHKPA